MREVIARYDDNGYGNVAGEIVGELIRCKDCKWCTSMESVWFGERGEVACSFFNSLLINEDDFCSNAERREENERER